MKGLPRLPQSHSQFFVSRVGDPAVLAIGRADIQRFPDWRRAHRLGKGAKGDVSARTVQKDRAVLHRIFDRAEKRGYREGNPVKAVEAPPLGDVRPMVILSVAEFERLMDACASNPMLRTFVLLLSDSDLRSDSEALHLRREDRDLRDATGFIRVVSGREGHRTKSGDPEMCL